MTKIKLNNKENCQLIIIEGFWTSFFYSSNGIFIYPIWFLVIFGLFFKLNYGLTLSILLGILSIIIVAYYSIETLSIINNNLMYKKSFGLIKKNIIIDNVSIIEIKKPIIRSSSYNYIIKVENIDKIEFGLIKIQNVLKLITFLNNYNKIEIKTDSETQRELNNLTKS